MPIVAIVVQGLLQPGPCSEGPVNRSLHDNQPPDPKDETMEAALRNDVAHPRAMRGPFPAMHEVLPDKAQVGRVRIAHATPSDDDVSFSNLRAAMRGRGSLRSGEVITQLYRDTTIPRPDGCGTFHASTLWMSDTPDERRDHLWAVSAAKGDVLIAGLGLGMVTAACALKATVQSVTVLEIDPEVVALVSPHLDRYLGADAPKVTVLQADVFTWKPPKGQTWDMLWFDVWADLSADNLPEYTKVKRRYGRRKREGGYMGCWAEHEVRRYAGGRRG